MIAPITTRRGAPTTAHGAHEAVAASISAALAAEAARQAADAAALHAQHARCLASAERAAQMRAWAWAQATRDLPADPPPDWHHPSLWWTLGGMVVGALFYLLTWWTL